MSPVSLWRLFLDVAVMKQIGNAMQPRNSFQLMSTKFQNIPWWGAEAFDVNCKSRWDDEINIESCSCNCSVYRLRRIMSLNRWILFNLHAGLHHNFHPNNLKQQWIRHHHVLCPSMGKFLSEPFSSMYPKYPKLAGNGVEDLSVYGHTFLCSFNQTKQHCLCLSHSDSLISFKWKKTHKQRNTPAWCLL